MHAEYGATQMFILLYVVSIHGFVLLEFVVGLVKYQGKKVYENDVLLEFRLRASTK